MIVCFLLIYCRFLSNAAAAATTAMIMTAALMMSKVSVEMPESG